MLQPAKCAFTRLPRQSILLNIVSMNRSTELRGGCVYIQKRGKKYYKKDSKKEQECNEKQPSTIIQPVPVKPDSSNEMNVGQELAGAVSKTHLVQVLNKFALMPQIHALALENQLTDVLFQQVMNDFRKYCLGSSVLPIDLHVVLSDIIQGAGNVVDIFPYFLRHARRVFPHIDCIDDLKKISDLRTPAKWYPKARSMNRKIIFHAGPTNSGKTHHALKRFLKAKSGIYCGPLKLLATEVFHKSNDAGTPCDLVTGEERKYACENGDPSSHVACTVEMTNLNMEYEVAVIDEVQMIRDFGRGWAWTRAFLGIPAKEVHLCGEAAALSLVRALCSSMNETLELHRYERLTDLIVEDAALASLRSIRKGDCIVCFSKNDIYAVTRNLEENDVEVSVIYGSLPPGTKLAQAAKFNNPNHPCKVLVATDAIGMGLNLHIRRIIFYSLTKPTMKESGEKEMNIISVSNAKQIAGRAGRFKTQWEKGYVTAFRPNDLSVLKKLLSQEPEAILQAGLHPTAEQIELYAYHLPGATLSNLMNIFIQLSTMDDSLYFMCNIDDFKFLADMIQHISLPLRARYVFCCAPINRKMPFVSAMFLKFVRQYSKNETITFEWLCGEISWSLKSPQTLQDLIHLENVFDIFDVYLWLSYRFPDLFPDAPTFRDAQAHLDEIIRKGVIHLTQLVKNNAAGLSSQFQMIDNHEENLEKQEKLLGLNLSRIPRGRLTDKLLQEGLLTPKMLNQLENEWIKRRSRDVNDNPKGLKRKFPRK